MTQDVRVHILDCHEKVSTYLKKEKKQIENTTLNESNTELLQAQQKSPLLPLCKIFFYTFSS